MYIYRVCLLSRNVQGQFACVLNWVIFYHPVKKYIYVYRQGVFTFTECTRTVCLCPKLGDFLSSSIYIQGDQKVSVNLILTIQKVTSNVQSAPRHPDRQGQGDTRLTLTPSVFPNSNYVIMVSD
jgi:hypothetical protein